MESNSRNNSKLCFNFSIKVLTICRLQLAATARDLTQAGTLNDRLAFTRRCQRLAAQIANHEQRAGAFLAALNAADHIPAAPPLQHAEEWDDLDEDDETAVDAIQEIDDEGDELPVYKITVVLPSSLGAAAIQHRGLENLLLAELDLRKGEAEDRLAELRVLLAWKSVSFRKGVRLAKNYDGRTRAWSVTCCAHVARMLWVHSIVVGPLRSLLFLGCTIIIALIHSLAPDPVLLCLVGIVVKILTTRHP